MVPQPVSCRIPLRYAAARALQPVCCSLFTSPQRGAASHSTGGAAARQLLHSSPLRCSPCDAAPSPLRSVCAAAPPLLSPQRGAASHSTGGAAAHGLPPLHRAAALVLHSPPLRCSPCAAAPALLCSPRAAAPAPPRSVVLHPIPQVVPQPPSCRLSTALQPCAAFLSTTCSPSAAAPAPLRSVVLHPIPQVVLQPPSCRLSTALHPCAAFLSTTCSPCAAAPSQFRSPCAAAPSLLRSLVLHPTPHVVPQPLSCRLSTALQPWCCSPLYYAAARVLPPLHCSAARVLQPLHCSAAWCCIPPSPQVVLQPVSCRLSTALQPLCCIPLHGSAARVLQPLHIPAAWCCIPFHRWCRSPRAAASPPLQPVCCSPFTAPQRVCCSPFTAPQPDATSHSTDGAAARELVKLPHSSPLRCSPCAAARLLQPLHFSTAWCCSPLHYLQPVCCSPFTALQTVCCSPFAAPQPSCCTVSSALSHGVMCWMHANTTSQNVVP
jgi:hypothetical protein